MIELTRTNDPVLLSWLLATLEDRRIAAVVLDGYTSVAEGSISAIQRRVMVDEGDYQAAAGVLKEADEIGRGTEPEVTHDALLDGRLRIAQPTGGLRAGLDAIFLAAAVPAAAGDVVLEVGAGSGAAALCLATRVEDIRVVGLELQPELARLANRNAEENGRRGRVEFIVGDLSRPPPRLAPGSFDHVLANPPHVAEGRGNRPPNVGKALAVGEGEARLKDWLAFCARMVRSRGTLTLIHRADRLDEVLAAASGLFGDLAVFPLWPAADRPAKRILLQGRRGVATPMRLLPGMVLHNADGTFTDEAEAVLRQAAAVRLS